MEPKRKIDILLAYLIIAAAYFLLIAIYFGMYSNKYYAIFPVLLCAGLATIAGYIFKNRTKFEAFVTTL